MTLDEFRQSLTATGPPAGLTHALALAGGVRRRLRTDASEPHPAPAHKCPVAHAISRSITPIQKPIQSRVHPLPVLAPAVIAQQIAQRLNLRVPNWRILNKSLQFAHVRIHHSARALCLMSQFEKNLPKTEGQNLRDTYGTPQPDTGATPGFVN